LDKKEPLKAFERIPDERGRTGSTIGPVCCQLYHDDDDDADDDIAKHGVTAQVK
jgi:hypothetical protein